MVDLTDKIGLLEAIEIVVAHTPEYIKKAFEKMERERKEKLKEQNYLNNNHLEKYKE